MARSSFSEILYLDSDNLVVRDPTFLFDSPVYKQYGIVLWPDLSKDSGESHSHSSGTKRKFSSVQRIEKIFYSTLLTSRLLLISCGM